MFVFVHDEIEHFNILRDLLSYSLLFIFGGSMLFLLLFIIHTYTLQCCNPWGFGKLDMTEQKQLGLPYYVDKYI